MKQGVELCPSDDRLCPDCYKENGRLLQGMHTSALEAATAAPTRSPTSSINGAAGHLDAPALANENKKFKPRQTRSKKNKSDEPAVQPTSQSNSHLGEIYEASHSMDCVQATVTAATDHSAELTALHQLVSNQESEIKRLRCQLDYVLSFLGVTEMVAESNNEGPLSALHVNQSRESHSDSTDAPANTEATETRDQASWSQVVSKRQQHSLRDTLQQSVVTAVYIDQSIKKSREASVIVTGLAPVTTKSDAEIFASICASELNFQPNINTVKRLGRQLVGKIQPLLVNLKKADQAKQLIDSAKKLRQSSDPIIREKVYINPNLTRAEAAAAYQIRVQRRTAQQQRLTRANGVGSSGGNDGSNTEHNFTSLQNPSLSVTRETLLNPLANSFKPTPAPTAAQAD